MNNNGTQTKPARKGTTRRLNRNKKHLPIVTEETVRAIMAEATEDKDKLFRQMAVGNPTLYRLIFDAYQAGADRDLMLGLIVGVYAMLEKQLQENPK